MKTLNDKLINANIEDKFKILDIYRSVMKNDFCTWDEYYPNMDNILEDIENNSLYLYYINDLLIGTISIIPNNELDEFDFWENKKAKEFARICILEEYQGNGYSLNIVNRIEDIIKILGYESIHILCAIKNIPAFKTYIKAGYIIKNKVFMYDNDYYAMEKIIK